MHAGDALDLLDVPVDVGVEGEQVGAVDGDRLVVELQELDVLREVGEEDLALAGDLHQRGALAGDRLLRHPLEAARAGVLELDVALVGDHRAQLRLDRLVRELDLEHFEPWSSNDSLPAVSLNSLSDASTDMPTSCDQLREWSGHPNGRPPGLASAGISARSSSPAAASGVPRPRDSASVRKPSSLPALHSTPEPFSQNRRQQSQCRQGAGAGRRSADSSPDPVQLQGSGEARIGAPASRLGPPRCPPARARPSHRSTRGARPSARADPRSERRPDGPSAAISPESSISDGPSCGEQKSRCARTIDSASVAWTHA